MVVKAIQIAKRIELVGYIICLLCLFWPWGKVSYLVPSQIDIVSNMQLVLLVQLLIVVVVRFLEKRLSLQLTWGDCLLVVYCLYISCRGGLYTINYIEFSTIILFYGVFRTIRVNQIFPCLMTVWLSGCLQVVYGFYEQSGFGYTPDVYLERIAGTFFNTGIFGGYILILFSIGVCCWWILPVMNKCCWGYMILSIFYLLVLYNTSSRAAWLACLFLVVYIFSDRYGWFKSRFLYALGLFIVLLALLVVVCICNDYKVDSIEGRLMIWMIAFYMICLYPIFGLGAPCLIHYLPKEEQSNYENWIVDFEDSDISKEDIKIFDSYAEKAIDPLERAKYQSGFSYKLLENYLLNFKF